MPDNNPQVIVVHDGELRNMEQLGAKIVRFLMRNPKATAFRIEMADRTVRPITSGSDIEGIG